MELKQSSIDSQLHNYYTNTNIYRAQQNLEVEH